jgi:HEPN domain-containing protein
MRTLIKRFVSSILGGLAMIRPYKKRFREPINPKHVFDQACRFHLARNHLLTAKTNWATIPVAVWSAFASELFLKCLHILEDKEPPDTHRLDVLFRRLSNTKKRRIEEIWDTSRWPGVIANLSKTIGKELPQRMIPNLKECGDTLYLGRYIYEQEGFAFMLQDFPDILLQAIQEIRPDWTTIHDVPQFRPTSLSR